MAAGLLALFLAAAAFREVAARPRGPALVAKGAGGRRAGAGTAGVADIVNSLGNIVASLEAEQVEAKGVGEARAAGCAATARNLTELLLRSDRDAREAQEDLQTIGAEASGLQADIDSTKAKIAALGLDIDDLVKRLGELRSGDQSKTKEAIVSMQQVETAIAQTYLRSQSAKRQMAKNLRQIDVPLSKRVHRLQELGGELEQQEQEEDAEEEAPQQAAAARAAAAAPAFLQASASSGRGRGRRGRRGAAGADSGDLDGEVGGRAGQSGSEAATLEDDKKQFELAAEDAKKDIDDDENALIEGLRVKREELKKLEESLRSLQPTLADKLKQGAETNRTLAAAMRGLARDMALRAALDTKCASFAGVFDEEHKLRFKMQGLMRMAMKLLQSMDTEAFLQKDLQDLPADDAAAPRTSAEAAQMSFVQLRAETNRPIRAAVSLSPAFLQEGAVTSAAGPFDDVQQMISALIASIQSQANNDVNKHQFCMENIAKSRQSRVASNNAIDLKMSEIRWAEAAIARLDEETTFYEAEQTRLTKAAKAADDELKAEENRRSKEATDHGTAKQVVERAMSVLEDLCDLDLEGDKQLARQADGKQTQCANAHEILQEAAAFFTEMDGKMAANLVKIQGWLAAEKQQATSAVQARGADLLAARSARGRRGEEFAAANTELEGLRRDLALIQKGQEELETVCGPKADSHDLRMQRRNEEIEALKNALSVLEGESIPVPSS